MVNLNNQYLYAKGTCDVVVRDIATGDVDYQSNKVQTNQFTTTADMGAIQAGIGNTTAINIPHNSAVNLTLTSPWKPALCRLALALPTTALARCAKC